MFTKSNEQKILDYVDNESRREFEKSIIKNYEAFKINFVDSNEFACRIFCKRTEGQKQTP